MARPIFERFMHYLESTPGVDYNKNVSFHIPEGGAGMEINCEAFNQALKIKPGTSTRRRI